MTTPAGFTKRPQHGAGLLYDIGVHVLDVLIWLFGMPTVVSYADDALAGVEGNLSIELQVRECTGCVQLSWDQPLKNELRVVGSEAEAVLRVDHFDKIAVGRAGAFEELNVDHEYVADADTGSGASLSPRLYTQSLYCQLIQFVRAIRLGESPAVVGETGRECVRLMESARRCARPLPMPWLDRSQQAAYEALHWTKA